MPLPASTIGDTLANLGVLTPGVLVGFGIAGILVRRLNERMFRYVVIVLVVLGGRYAPGPRTVLVKK